MAQTFKLKHPDGRFVHRGTDGEYFLEDVAIESIPLEMTLSEFRKASKYIKAETTYKKGNLKFKAGTIQKWIWNGGTELEVIDSPKEPTMKEFKEEAAKLKDIPKKPKGKTLKEKVLDWAFKGIEFNHNDGDVESSGELLYIRAVKEGENPFLVAARLESKRMIRFRAYEPTEMAGEIKAIIRAEFKQTGWQGVLL